MSPRSSACNHGNRSKPWKELQHHESVELFVSSCQFFLLILWKTQLCSSMNYCHVETVMAFITDAALPPMLARRPAPITCHLLGHRRAWARAFVLSPSYAFRSRLSWFPHHPQMMMNSKSSGLASHGKGQEVWGLLDLTKYTPTNHQTASCEKTPSGQELEMDSNPFRRSSSEAQPMYAGLVGAMLTLWNTSALSGN